MTHVRVLAAALLAVALCSGARAAGAEPLTACGHPAYPPVSWTTQGQLKGLAPEVTRLLFGELGYDVRIDPLGNWKRCLHEVAEGRVDIVVAAYRTSERAGTFAFATEPLIVDSIGLFVRRDRSFAFSRWADLQGKTVGLLLGDSFGERFDRFADSHLQVERVSRSQQNVRKLVLGRIDFMPIGLATWRLQERSLGYGDEIVPLPMPLSSENYYIAVRRGSKLAAKLGYVDRRLREMRDNGSLGQMEQEQAGAYLADLAVSGRR